MYTCACVVFVCLCYVYFAANRLLQLASVVCLVACGLVSCDGTLLTKSHVALLYYMVPSMLDLQTVS